LDSFVTVELEIRATKAQVTGTASLAQNAVHWLWPTPQVANIAGDRELPDGTRQVIVADGDKLRDKVVSSEDGSVIIESEFRPRKDEVPGRKMKYELSVEPGHGTAIAKLGLSFMDRENPAAASEVRRWRRHAEQCLRRLSGLAAPERDDDAS